jgi:hypothetical protein
MRRLAQILPGEGYKTNINAWQDRNAPETAELDYALPSLSLTPIPWWDWEVSILTVPTLPIGLMALGTPIITKPIGARDSRQPDRIHIDIL